MKPCRLRRVLWPVGFALRLLVFLWLVVAVPTRGQNVVINELMATNATYFSTNGIFSDWIELYNTNAYTVNLFNWSLSDSRTAPRKYVFTGNVLLEPFQTLVLYCDGLTNLGWNHTSFSLKTSGENLALYNSSIIKVDEIVFGLQLPDTSSGRYPDGTGAWQLTTPTMGTANQPLPIGLTSTLKINEWCATNISVVESNYDWLEIYNPDPNPVPLGGLVITSDVPPNGYANNPLTALSFIEGSGFVRLWCVGNRAKGADELDFKISHNTGETITLFDTTRTNIIDQVSFLGSSDPNCPNCLATPDSSMGRLPDGGANTKYFPPGKSTPAASNVLPLTNVLINEVLFHTDPPLEDAIELVNITSDSVDVSGWYLSNKKEIPNKFKIPSGTIIPAGGSKVIYEYRGVIPPPGSPPLGFNTSGTGDFPDFTINSAHGDELYLYETDSGGNLTGYRKGVDFSATERGVSMGRFTNSVGEVDFVALSARTLGVDNPASVEQFRQGQGLPNAPAKVGPLVISEVMYHPPDVAVYTNFVWVTNDNILGEYVEIYNMSDHQINLFGTNVDMATDYTNTWGVKDAIDLKLPWQQFPTIDSGEFILLVNFNPQTDLSTLAAFRQNYNVPQSFTNFYGPYGGQLRNSDESIELFKPDRRQAPPHPDAGYTPQILVERVHYSDSAPWPVEPDGDGYSLDRRTPELYANDPGNWRAAQPTPGRQNIQVAVTKDTPTSVTVRFTAWPAMSYSVQYTDTLQPASWTTIAEFPRQTSTGILSYTDNNPPSSTRFYRVVTP